MKFVDAWVKAFPGQILKSGEFIIVKGEFLTADLLIVFWADRPMNTGWEITDSVARQALP